ncbi:MAG: iron ABC transporter permease [Thermodesulfobacteriota bacterium]
MRATPKTLACSMILLAVLLAAAVLVSLGAGTVYTPLATVWKWLLGEPVETSLAVILSNFRLPRIILAALAGASLSMCGTAFQGLLRNPLAEPFILGVSGAAAAGAVSCYISGFTGPEWTAISAFAGAGVAILMVLGVSRRSGRMDTTTMILTGVMINAFFTAVIMFLISVADEHKLQAIMFWLYGDLSGATLKQARLLGPVVLLGGLMLFFHSRKLNLLIAGEHTAAAAGVQVEKTKLLLFLLASLLTGVTVSLSGLIGFVGLVVPHLVRIAFGQDHRLQIPAAGLFGAFFLLIADTFARTIIGPAQLPVGVITAFLGVPFFLGLMGGKGSHWWSR